MKDSGIEWLGEIPAHWEVKSLKHVATILEDRLNRRPDSSVYVGLEDMVSWSGRLIVESDSDNVESNVNVFSTRDVLFGKLRPYLAKVAVAPFDGVCTTEIVAIRAFADTSVDFIFYCLIDRQFIDHVDRLTYGAKMPRVSPEQLGNSPHPVPPLPEQRAIADYLDNETTRIDTLIEKKRRLTNLLAERRQAIITEAVTKGLDRTAAMKDSGIEWLGEIPAHWEAKRLKHLGHLRAGAGFPEVEQGILDEEIPFFKVGDLAPNRNVRFMNNWQHSISTDTARRLRAFVFPQDTIVFAKIGAALYLNRRRVLPHPACIDNNMMGFTPQTCCPRWAFYLLNTVDLAWLVNPGAVPSVGENRLSNVQIACPPLPEQRAIADHLDTETQRIDTLVNKLERQIDLLAERRQAVITAAVTGKLDVSDPSLIKPNPQNL